MRLFVAIDLDETVRAALAAEQSRVKRALGEHASGLKWVKPEHLHLTLVFLGEVPDAQAASVIAAIDTPVDQPPFEIVFGGLGAFPPRGAPRALWVAAVRGGDGAQRLQEELARRIGALGLALDARPFSPHLTLARWRDSRPSDRGRALEHGGPDAIGRMTVDHATLYQSRLSSAGPTYVPLARATLSGR